MKTVWLSLIGCLLVCGSYAAQALHKGRPISLWLRDLISEKTEERIQAEKELRLIGTNALPAMLSYVTSVGSAFSPDDSNVAKESFRILGATAKPAIPQLTVLANDPNYSSDACRALFLIGRETIPIFAQSLTNRLPGIRQNALDGIIAFAMATNSVADLQIALPPIQHILKSDKTVDAQPLIALRLITTNASEFVSHVTPLLESPDATTKWCAVQSLNIYGPNAKAAIPALLRIANDKDEKVRIAVAFAIEAIDPTAAKRAGIKAPVYE